MSPQAQTKPASQLREANHYKLCNGSLNIIYTANDLLGRPQLNYQDGKQTQNFVGDQIRREETALGLLVSVGAGASDLTPKYRFTLVLPRVLVGEQPAELTTFIVFENRSPIGRLPQPGPLESYSVKSLSGTANTIIS